MLKKDPMLGTYCQQNINGIYMKSSIKIYLMPNYWCITLHLPIIDFLFIYFCFLRSMPTYSLLSEPAHQVLYQVSSGPQQIRRRGCPSSRSSAHQQFLTHSGNCVYSSHNGSNWKREVTNEDVDHISQRLFGIHCEQIVKLLKQLFSTNTIGEEHNAQCQQKFILEMCYVEFGTYSANEI